MKKSKGWKLLKGLKWETANTGRSAVVACWLGKPANDRQSHFAQAKKDAKLSAFHSLQLSGLGQLSTPVEGKSERPRVLPRRMAPRTSRTS
jgi:hypothetical protein